MGIFRWRCEGGACEHHIGSDYSMNLFVWKELLSFSDRYTTPPQLLHQTTSVMVVIIPLYNSKDLSGSPYLTGQGYIT